MLTLLESFPKFYSKILDNALVLRGARLFLEMLITFYQNLLIFMTSLGNLRG